MRHKSLFSGMSGFDLASEWLGWDNVSHTEWNSFCQQILKYYWPKADSYGDITKTDYTKYRNTIDVLSGGFPCQGNSLAGNRLGTDDDRYLWPEMLRVIDETKPISVVGENVTGILSVEDRTGIYRDIFPKVENRTITRFHDVDHFEALYTRQAKMLVNSICEDLEKRGYEVQTFAIPAASVGAPHRRERIWFVANSNSNDAWRYRYDKIGQEKIGFESKKQEWQRLRIISQRTSSERAFAYTDGIGLRGQGDRIGKSRFFNKKGEVYDWKDFPTQSPICDGNDGFSTKLDGITFPKWRNESIKAGGNAIVPQIAVEIFKAIEKYESNYK